MVYVDSSAALAHIGAEDVHPPPELWRQNLVSSRLIEYEIWTRLHARELARSHGETARALLRRISTLELVEPVLTRVGEGVPGGVRTLDALHLSSMSFLREQGVDVRLATYDRRMRAAAQEMGFGLFPLS